MGLAALWLFRPDLLGVAGRTVVLSGHRDRAELVHLNARGAGKREAEAGPDEWVDLSRDAFQQGDVRLRLVSVLVRAAPRVRRAPPIRDLVIGLRITNVGIERRIPYAGWSTAELIDEEGIRYRSKGMAAPAAQLLPPGKYVNEVLVFEAPRTGGGRLRLELPGSGVGLAGPLRLEIPERMIDRR